MNTQPIVIDLSQAVEPVERMAFTHKSWLGALSLAWDAGIENCHAWSQRLWVGGEWTVVYQVKS